MIKIPFLARRKYTQIIRNQTEFDALVVAENDKIKLDGDFVGSIDVDQDNVEIWDGSISGGVDISGLTWTDEGGGVYSTPMETDPQWINIGGESAKLAETDWLSVTGIASTDQITITHADVSSYTSIVGCYIVFKDRPFSYSDRYTVQAYNGAGLLTLDRARHSNIGASDEYKLFNNDEFFGSGVEWIWRSEEIRVKTPVSPAALIITMSTYDYGVNVTGKNCTVRNVELKEQYFYGVKSIADDTTVFNCVIHDIRGQGIKILTQIARPRILKNQIYNIGHNGVWCGPQTTINVEKNNIYNIGMGENIGWNNESFDGISFTDGTGIKINYDKNNPTHDAANITIANNIIDNCAYNGISLHIGQNGSIKRNRVTNTNKLIEDGAGIYCFHYRPTNVLFSGFLVEENFVDATASGDVFGIYMDNRCANNEVSKNVVTAIDGGIMINADTKIHNVHDNTIYAASNRALWFRDWAAPDKIYDNDGNLINNNILIAKNTSTYPMQFSDSVNPYANGGSGDNNIYISPYGTTVLNDGSNKTLAQLQSTYSQDANSVELTNYITAPGDPDNEILLIENPSDDVLEGTAPAGSWYDVDGVLTTSYSVPAWGSLVLLKDLI